MTVKIFPDDFSRKVTPAANDKVQIANSEDGDKIYYALWSDLKGLKGDKGDQGDQGDQGDPGDDGQSQYLWIAYASSTGGAGFSYTPSGSLKYTAQLVTNTNTPPASGDFAGLWVKYIGDNGLGSGDMLASTYDPTNKAADAFNTDNHVNGTTNKVYTATEKTKLAGIASGATANDTDANLKARANHTGTQTASTISDFDTQVRTSRLDQMAAPSADVSMNSHKITNVTDPTSAQDAATKNYVDNYITGITWKTAVRVATTANGTLASAFANGQTVDGVSLVTGDRILIKNQSSGAENGIYVVAASGAPTRATDSDTGAELVSATVLIKEGTTNADTQWTCTNNSITLGSTSVVFAQIAGAGTYTPGTGIGLSGNVFSIDTATTVDKTTAQTLTNKTLSDSTTKVGAAADLTKALAFLLSGATTAKTMTIASNHTNDRTITLPDATDTLVGKATTDTLTNKRVTKRVSTVTQSATPTINTDNMDVASITGLAQAITSMTTNLSGTPTDGDMLIVRITDNGTARAITWGSSFESSTVTLPSTTVISTMLVVGFIWNAAASKWRCVATA